MALPDGALEGGEELLKQRAGVVWAGGGLGMVLNSEHRQLPVSQALDGSVIQVHVRNLELACACYAALVTFYREAMVLRCYQYPSG